MANNSEEKQFRRDTEEFSENPPSSASARPSNWSRGRPFSRHSPHTSNQKRSRPSMFHPDWRRDGYYEQPCGYGPPPQPPPWSSYSYSNRAIPSGGSSYHRYPPNDYWRYQYHLGSRLRSPQTDREELEILIGTIGQENEELKSHNRHMQSSLDERIEIIANLKRKRTQEGEEVKDLKANVTRLETEVAGKDEEIKELKVKLGKFKRELNESKEECEKLTKEQSENVNKIEGELKRAKEEIRLGRIELTREKNVNRNGKAQVKKLIMQKKKIWEELQKANKREGASTSFQNSYTKVLDNNTKQRETIENLISNMMLQRSNYEYIIDHYSRSYTELYKEFCDIHETYKEQYELKEATEDSPFATAVNYHRSADIIRCECLSKFNDLETLTTEFARLSDQNSRPRDPLDFIARIFVD